VCGWVGVGVACMYACVYGYGYMSVCVTRPYMYGSIYVLMDHVPNSSPADLSGYIHVYAHKHTLTHTLTHTHTHTHSGSMVSLGAELPNAPVCPQLPQPAPPAPPPHTPAPSAYLLRMHLGIAVFPSQSSLTLSLTSLTRSLSPPPPVFPVLTA